ncbi:sensor histidine kinase [Microlunatus elymi]|uniref:sensor histidine kinase n=1 Tax=Microlunatus elymi TaxID=2596828 RepID=UPI00143DEEDE|nr:ATP-binding protein [Microlunatus elymi]
MSERDIRGDVGALPATVCRQLRAVITEAVDNVITHARATRLSVRVEVTDAQVEARVADDGIGPPDPPIYGLGLGSMAARARDLGGSFGFDAAAKGGTIVTWRVPLMSPDQNA